MTSRPLLASVAESIVILAPMVQVGWRRARSGVTDGELLGRRVEERPARRGQHEARDRRPRLAHQALPDGRMLGVDRPQPGERRPRAGHRRRPRRASRPARRPPPSPGGRRRRASPCWPSRPPCRLAAPRGWAAARPHRRYRRSRGRRRRGSRARGARRPPRIRVVPAGRSSARPRRRARPRRGRSRRACASSSAAVATGGQRRDPEPVGVRLEDLHGLAPDAPGGSQQRDAEAPAVSERARRHTARPAGRRTGTSRSGRGCRRGPGSASPSPWRPPPA